MHTLFRMVNFTPYKIEIHPFGVAKALGIDPCEIPNTIELNSRSNSTQNMIKSQPKIASSVSEQVTTEIFNEIHHHLRRFLGKDLSGIGFKELQQLEQLLNEGLLSVKDRKEEILMEQLEQSRIKEQRVMMENTNLCKQIEELRSYFPVSARPVGGYLEYNPETRNSPIRDGASSPEAVCKSRAENGDLMTTLQLGPPSHGHRKRKSPEKETHFSTSESQIDM